MEVLLIVWMSSQSVMAVPMVNMAACQAALRKT